MELNNGEPSGGYQLNAARQSLLINMLEFLQGADSYPQLQHALYASESDYSLIVNTASWNETKSFEFSSRSNGLGGLRSFYPDQSDCFVSTNFYLNQTWPNLPIPTDETTWFGVTRRNNLLDLLNATEQHDVESMKTVMDTRIEQGGAVWDTTIYQMIFDSADMSLYLKSTKHQRDWTQIALPTLFQPSDNPPVAKGSDLFVPAAITMTACFALGGLGFFAYKRYKGMQTAPANEMQASFLPVPSE